MYARLYATDGCGLVVKIVLIFLCVCRIIVMLRTGKAFAIALWGRITARPPRSSRKNKTTPLKGHLNHSRRTVRRRQQQQQQRVPISPTVVHGFTTRERSVPWVRHQPANMLIAYDVHYITTPRACAYQTDRHKCAQQRA